jgi:hypothetical protein
MALTMYPSRTQALFRHLPGQTYNWQGGQGVYRGLADVDADLMDMPRTWIKRPLLRLLRPFVTAPGTPASSVSALEMIERERFDIREPRRFRGEPFPNTFLCSNCRRFFTGSSPATLEAPCPNPACKGRAYRQSFVEFHRCGHLSGLNAPLCKNNCRAGMRLLNTESRSFKDWEWECVRCKTRPSLGVYHWCPQCKKDSVAVMRADANQVYYSQYIKVINPPRQGDYALLEAKNIYDAAVAQAMGAVPPGLEGLRRAVNEGGNEAALDKTRQRLIEDFGFAADDPQIDMLLKKRQGIIEQQDDWTTAVTALGLAEEPLADLGYQCVELTFARAAASLGFTDLARDAPSIALRSLYVTEYPQIMQRYGLAEITLIREFPMAFVVAGYTRELRKPEEDLNKPPVDFQFFKGANARFAMYGQRTTTEALLFRLDPARVVAWLVRSGIIPAPAPTDPQGWIFKTFQPVPGYFEPPADRITQAILELVHSFAHRALKAVSIRSGLAAESLAEYLFPQNLTFLVFADTRSEFILGGLEHVYRNYLAESLRQMDADRRCVFDPPCTKQGGACAICMHLAETSCERFNRGLSRQYLFGGEREGVQWEGYWNPWMP